MWTAFLLQPKYDLNTFYTAANFAWENDFATGEEEPRALLKSKLQRSTANRKRAL